MVNGIDIFREHFNHFKEQYTVIGGFACDLLMNDAGLDFRQTVDIDMVLIVEALTTDFAKAFWAFIEAGGYQARQRSNGQPEFYRFVDPTNPAYPKMIELFSRPQSNVVLQPDTHLMPLHIDDEVSSLSAILLNDDYYHFLLDMPTKYEYSCEVRPNGTINKTAIYGAFKNTTKLKEVHIVRYADDFKLFCRKRSDAEKVFIAVKLWLQDRLKLEISEEKSKIVNLKRHYSKFLGFEMKAVKKRKRYVVKSHMTEKAISKETAALIEQVKQIAHVQDRDDEAREITLYNSMVFGIHNYYRYATMIATDCEQIHRAVSTVMKNRLYGRLTKKGQINEVYIRKNYGDSKQIRFISSKTVAPVGYIQTKTPLFKKKKVCKYTPEGRAEIHKNLGINTSIMLALMRIKEPRRSVEYMDNRISLYAAQYGRCAVTGKELWLDEIHCHHKQPLCRGGTDKYMNLVIVHRDIHRLIHATDPNTIVVYLNLFQLDKKALAKLNALRVLTGQPEI